jgi:hypothetical protein
MLEKAVAASGQEAELSRHHQGTEEVLYVWTCSTEMHLRLLLLVAATYVAADLKVLL